MSLQTTAENSQGRCWRDVAVRSRHEQRRPRKISRRQSTTGSNVHVAILNVTAINRLSLNYSEQVRNCDMDIGNRVMPMAPIVLRWKSPRKKSPNY